MESHSLREGNRGPRLESLSKEAQKTSTPIITKLQVFFFPEIPGTEKKTNSKNSALKLHNIQVYWQTLRSYKHKWYKVKALFGFASKASM